MLRAVMRRPSKNEIETWNARRLPLLVCRIAGHSWKLEDETEERRVRIVVPPGSTEQVSFVHDQTCSRCGAEVWAETPRG